MTSITTSTKATFDLQSFLSSSDADQQQNFGVTLTDILLNTSESQLVELSDENFNCLESKLGGAAQTRKRWAEVIECSRETAMLHDYNGFTFGELGDQYFYFQHTRLRDFTNDEIEHLEAYPACCYLQGYCCLAELGRNYEDDYDGSQCECQMGHENGEYRICSGHQYIGDNTIDDERHYGLIEPIFNIYEKKMEDGIMVRHCSPVLIYSVVELAQKIEDYTATDSDNVLIHAFWANGIKNDLILESMDIEVVVITPEYNGEES